MEQNSPTKEVKHVTFADDFSFNQKSMMKEYLNNMVEYHPNECVNFIKQREKTKQLMRDLADQQAKFQNAAHEFFKVDDDEDFVEDDFSYSLQNSSQASPSKD